MDKKKPYISQLEEKYEAYKNALDLLLAWNEAEEKVNNTAYKRDAMNLADIAKQKAIDALAEVKKYEEE